MAVSRETGNVEFWLVCVIKVAVVDWSVVRPRVYPRAMSVDRSKVYPACHASGQV